MVDTGNDDVVHDIVSFDNVPLAASGGGKHPSIPIGNIFGLNV